MNAPNPYVDPGVTLPCPEVPWSQAQWDKVRQVVAAEAQKSRVAASFLSLYGPLPGDSDFVRRDLISTISSPTSSSNGSGENQQRLEIDDTSTIRLWTLQVNLHLRGPQLADPEMTSALALFRRAANVLARLEDTVVFNGIPTLSDPPPVKPCQASKQMALLPPIWDILGRRCNDNTRFMTGLLPLSPQRCPGYDPLSSELDHEKNSPFRQWEAVPWTGPEPPRTSEDFARLGNHLVGVISEAIGRLESQGHYGPFAVVLGQSLFQALQTPNESSLVLPQDRVVPFLGSGGCLQRSTTLPDQQGVIVALGGDPVELVIAKDIAVDFLQVTQDPSFVFRLHEKLVLRIKTPGAICGLRLPDPPASTAGKTSTSTSRGK
ncbi:MAG: family 1 encapsulin nanocompartment shell protein [Cyanobacteriota bacterium]|nr:family 1 encapsulin nanocompartment shell protein [Cyanobacteriota bacterium]